MPRVLSSTRTASTSTRTAVQAAALPAGLGRRAAAPLPQQRRVADAAPTAGRSPAAARLVPSAALAVAAETSTFVYDSSNLAHR